jgi:hypothetical protein
MDMVDTLVPDLTDVGLGELADGSEHESEVSFNSSI